MPNTTNFNWATPADTDLVKDGAAAIRTLGNSIDSSFVDLKGGTTGQILSKASNTDLDFTFVTPNVGDITEVQAGTGISVASGTGPVPVVTNSMATEITAKGDLIVGTGSGTFDNLPAGTNGYTLVADSVETTGLKWVAPAAGGAYTSIASGSLSSNAVNITSISGSYTDLYLVIKDLSLNTDGEMSIRMNNDSNSNRHYILGDAYPFGGAQFQVSAVGTSFKFNSNNIDSPDADNQFTFRLNNYSVAQKHTGIIQSQYINTSSAQESYTVHCYYYQNDAITEVNLLTNQTFSGGTYILYGVK